MKIWRRGELTYGRRELLVLHRGDNAEGTLDVAHLANALIRLLTVCVSGGTPRCCMSW